MQSDNSMKLNRISLLAHVVELGRDFSVWSLSDAARVLLLLYWAYAFSKMVGCNSFIVYICGVMNNIFIGQKAF